MGNAFVASLQNLPKRIYTKPRDAKLRTMHEREIQRVLDAGVDSFQRLAAFARDSKQKRELRGMACWLLGRLGGKRAAEALLEVLRGNNRLLWMQAATSLGVTHSRLATRPLITMLRGDRSPERRKAAVHALSWLGDQRARKHLLATFRNKREVPAIRAQAAEGLGIFQYRPALHVLIEGLEDKAVAVRFWAAYALAMLEDPRAIPALKSLAATDEAIMPHWWSVKREARWAIRQIRDRNRGQPPLIR